MLLCSAGTQPSLQGGQDRTAHAEGEEAQRQRAGDRTEHDARDGVGRQRF